MRQKKSSSSNNSEVTPEPESHNKGFWSKDEKKKFDKFVMKYYEGKISKSELSRCMLPERTEKQVFSHFHKAEYIYKRKYGTIKEKSSRIRELEAMRKAFQREAKKGTKQLIKFEDELTKRTVYIDPSFLETLIKCQPSRALNCQILNVMNDDNLLNLVSQIRYLEIMMKQRVSNDNFIQGQGRDDTSEELEEEEEDEMSQMYKSNSPGNLDMGELINRMNSTGSGSKAKLQSCFPNGDDYQVHKIEMDGDDGMQIVRPFDSDTKKGNFHASSLRPLTIYQHDNLFSDRQGDFVNKKIRNLFFSSSDADEGRQDYFFSNNRDYACNNEL